MNPSTAPGESNLLPTSEAIIELLLSIPFFLFLTLPLEVFLQALFLDFYPTFVPLDQDFFSDS